MGNREVYPNLSMTLLHSFRNVKTFSRRPLCSWRQLRKKKKKLSWILQLTKVASGSCPLLSAVRKTCTREWGLSLSTSKWRFEWLCRGAFLSRVCRRRRLVNRSGWHYVTVTADYVEKKTNTRRYSIVENWIRLLLSPLPLPPLMVPVCLPDMVKCWVLYINVSSLSPIRLTPSRSARHLVRFIREPLQLLSLTKNQQIVWNVGVCVYKEKDLDLEFFFFLKKKKKKREDNANGQRSKKSSHFTIRGAEYESSIFRSLSTEYLK